MSIHKIMITTSISGGVLPFSNEYCNTSLPKNYISIKISRNNYDGLTYLREHEQNVHGISELVVTQCEKSFPNFLGVYVCMV